MADVVVVGAGPAGATAAICLGRAGLRVDVFDAQRFPREKPCGEGIMPAGVAVLARLGLLEAVGGRALASVRYHGFGLTAEAGFPSPPASFARPMSPMSTESTRSPVASLASPWAADRAPFALAQRRWVLDQRLVAAARATPGVRVFEGARVDGVLFAHGRAAGVWVDGQAHRAALVVGADGVHSRVRRALGLDVPARERDGAGRVGVRRHFRLAPGVPAPTRLEIFVGRGYELYCAPLPERELLVAALCSRAAVATGAAEAFARFVAAEPRLAAWLDGAEPITEVAGRYPVVRRARAGFGPGAVLLGDAARASDPLTAGGITHALVTAERLAAAVPRILAEGELATAEFDRERRALLRAHEWLTRGLLFVVGRPALAHLTLRAVRAFPGAMRALLGIGGGVGVQPPRVASRISVATNSVLALAISNATATNDVPSQRVGSA